MEHMLIQVGLLESLWFQDVWSVLIYRSGGGDKAGTGASLCVLYGL